MITGSQTRAARAFLKWSARELAEKSQIHINTIQRIEKEDGIPNATAQTIATIQKALEDAGVEFIDNGVKLKK